MRNDAFAATPATEHDIFFATNRKPSSANSFGSDHSDLLHFGLCKVSIPERHGLGKVERPRTLLVTRPVDPRLHVVMKAQARMTDADFYAVLRERSATSALVFLHGFNTPFEDVIFRAAQMKHDLKFRGSMIVFSWPSSGEFEYRRDCESLKISQIFFDRFLRNLIDLTSRDGYSMNLLAHSLGNQLAINSLYLLASQSSLPSFDHVVFAAPDVASTLVRSYAHAISSTARSLTLYVSSNDWALDASHLLCKFHRAGDSRDKNQIVVVPNITTVDVSSLNTRAFGHSFFGHSYITSSRDILSDLARLLADEKPPRFGMIPVTHSSGTYWSFSR